MLKAMGKFQIALLAVTFVCSVVSLFLLPETVAVQWNKNGVSNYLPRFIACWIPFMVSVLSFAGWKVTSMHFEKAFEINQKFCVAHTIVWTIISLLGILLHLILWLTN